MWFACFPIMGWIQLSGVNYSCGERGIRKSCDSMDEWIQGNSSIVRINNYYFKSVWPQIEGNC